MSVINSGHPSISALAAFALGKLDAPTAETVHNHLAGCPECRTVVETTPGDTLMGLLKKAAGRPGDTASLTASVFKGTLPVPNPEFDVAALSAELRDHPRYRIIRKLGEGGMGAVYEAEHRIMERVVAIKVIAGSLVDSPDAIERFQREVRAAAKLEHANIVRAYDADQAGGAMLLAMEFVKGRTLAEVIASKGPVPVAYACQCVRQAALGLQHAADNQMVHRDIKPQNLMLTEKGLVKILDFGLAKLVSERLSRPGLTGKDMVMGTPEYMAPEQARDTASADIRADIYALGCTLFYLLTGRPPFSGSSAIEILTKHAMNTAPRVTELRPEVPAELVDLVERMLAKDPAERPQLPRDVAEALKAYMKPSGKTPPPTTPRPGATPAARRLWLVPAVVAVGMALIGVGLWAGGVFKVKTKDGTIVLENLPGDAEVTVDDEKATLKTGAGQAATVSLAAGKKRRLQVKKDGFTTFGEEVEIDAGGSRTITGRLEPVVGDGVPGGRDLLAAAVRAPEKSEWAGTGVFKNPNGEGPIGAAWTFTERRGQAFKALWRGGWGWKAIYEGVIDANGRITLEAREFLAPEAKPREEIKGNGEVGSERMMLLIENPNNGATTRIDFKRLDDAGANFNFAGRWTCVQTPGGWKGVRTVSDDGTFLDWNGQLFTWSRDGGLIHVEWPNGHEWLAIDPGNPNELNGGSTWDKGVKWIRQ